MYLPFATRDNNLPSSLNPSFDKSLIISLNIADETVKFEHVF